MAVLAALVLAMSAAMSLTVLTQPAHADRCQPEELIPGYGTSPVPEEASPLCLVMDELVYPLVGCTGTAADCMESIRKDPDGTVTIVIDRAPNTPGYALNVAKDAVPTTIRLVRYGTDRQNSCRAVRDNPYMPLLIECDS